MKVHPVQRKPWPVSGPWGVLSSTFIATNVFHRSLCVKWPRNAIKDVTLMSRTHDTTLWLPDCWTSVVFIVIYRSWQYNWRPPAADDRVRRHTKPMGRRQVTHSQSLRSDVFSYVSSFHPISVKRVFFDAVFFIHVDSIKIKSTEILS